VIDEAIRLVRLTVLLYSNAMIGVINEILKEIARKKE